MTRWNATRGTNVLVAGCLTAALLLVPAPAWSKVKSDWSKVRAVPEGTKTQVVLYDDEAPQGARKIRGRFHSATESSVTLLAPTGESRTFEKRSVRKVRVPRPWYARYPGWIALVIGQVLLPIPAGDEEGYLFLLDPAFFATTSSITLGFFLGTARVREIYNVPPEHRTP